MTEVCPICFLDHEIATCNAIKSYQQFIYRGYVSHEGYISNGSVKRKGVHEIKVPVGWDDDGYACDFTRLSVCNIKALKIISAYRPPDPDSTWFDEYVTRKNAYGFEYLASRYIHLTQEYEGTVLLRVAYRLAHPGMEDALPGFNFRVYQGE